MMTYSLSARASVAPLTVLASSRPSAKLPAASGLKAIRGSRDAFNFSIAAWRSAMNFWIETGSTWMSLLSVFVDIFPSWLAVLGASLRREAVRPARRSSRPDLAGLCREQAGDHTVRLNDVGLDR